MKNLRDCVFLKLVTTCPLFYLGPFMVLRRGCWQVHQNIEITLDRTLVRFTGVPA